ncbi:MAG: TonB-dependent receptor, partial [Desulfobacteraceae bacterium]|nr:TonB-dependent receptor [Desulfobacteraceae bacterium]
SGSHSVIRFFRRICIPGKRFFPGIPLSDFPYYRTGCETQKNICDQELFFKALYGEAFRAPSFRELYIRNTSTLVGNENLKPENITTIEGLIGYNFTENIRGSITCFDISTEDMILPVDQEAHFLMYENVGKTNARGWKPN